MLRNLSALVASVALVLLAGFVCGTWTDRWQVSHEAERAREGIPRIPLEIGPWRGRDSDRGDPARYGRVGILAHTARTYENPETGATVAILLVCGRPGPISAHTPQTCLGESGYEMTTEPVNLSVPAGPAGSAGFQEAEFTRYEAAVPVTQKVYWAWRAAATWEGLSGDSARVAFARYPALYKLYVTRVTTAADAVLEEDPCEDFLGQFLPAVEETLFAAGPPGRGAQTAALRPDRTGPGSVIR